MKTFTMYRPQGIQNALSDFERCFESFFDGSIIASTERILHYSPAVNIQETENCYVMEMELPGFDEKNIEIHIDGLNLTIASKQEEKKEGEKEETGKYILRERRQDTFYRSFELPKNADPEAVSAVFKNGILSLNINKRAEAQKKTIHINAA